MSRTCRGRVARCRGRVVRCRGDVAEMSRHVAGVSCGVVWCRGDVVDLSRRVARCRAVSCDVDSVLRYVNALTSFRKLVRLVVPHQVR